MSSKNRKDEAKGEPRPFSRDELGRLCYRGKLLPAGPWHAEPDRVELEQDGIPCLLLRGPMGAWCGYVGLPREHSWARADLITGGHPTSPWPEHAPEITYQKRSPPTNAPPGHATECEQWIGFSCVTPGGSTLEIQALLDGSGPPHDYRELARAEEEIRCLARLVLDALPN